MAKAIKDLGVSIPEETTKTKESSMDGMIDWKEHARRITDSVVPIAYREARLSDFKDINKDNIDWSQYGFCFRGKTGIGKTHLATAVAKEYFFPKHPKSIIMSDGTYQRRALAWVAAPELLSRIRSTFGNNGGDSEYSILEDLFKPQVMILDDIGAEKTSDFSASTIYALISGRRNRCRVTIVTTNQSMNEINEWEPRVASRLGEMATIKLPDIDRRIQD